MLRVPPLGGQILILLVSEGKLWEEAVIKVIPCKVHFGTQQ